MKQGKAPQGSFFDLAAAGAVTAGTASADDSAPTAVPPCNPSVDALRERFPDAVVRNEYAPATRMSCTSTRRVGEVLGWLHETPEQHYDHLADVTAVDHGGGRPIEVVYQLWSIPHRAACA